MTTCGGGLALALALALALTLALALALALALTRWGEGTQRYGESGDVLTGSWERGQLHGAGRMLGGRGEAYEGEFCNGLRDGEGECVYCDGAVYRGQVRVRVRVRDRVRLHNPGPNPNPSPNPNPDPNPDRGQWAAGLCEGHGRLQQADAYQPEPEPPP